MMKLFTIQTWEITREEMCFISQYQDYIVPNAGMLDELERIRKEVVMA
jgi:hypothetical protein